MTRLDAIEIPLLTRLQAECDWFALKTVWGHGPSRFLEMELRVPAYAWQKHASTYHLRPGPWTAQIALPRFMIVQPLVRVHPDTDGYLPISGNISDWWVANGPGVPGLVCYCGRWDPTALSTVWVVTQVARILSGEVFHLEASPFSQRGRDLQASLLSEGKLPTCAVAPPEDLLSPRTRTRRRDNGGIEFDER
jgi:hypothetical protein